MTEDELQQFLQETLAEVYAKGLKAGIESSASFADKYAERLRSKIDLPGVPACIAALEELTAALRTKVMDANGNTKWQ